MDLLPKSKEIIVLISSLVFSTPHKARENMSSCLGYELMVKLIVYSTPLLKRS